jgi:hypothetical protein
MPGLTAPVPGLSWLAYVWFIVTSVVVVIDASFVLGRPATLSSLSEPWKTWQLYAVHDKRYGDLEDAFCRLQSYLNLVEVALQLLAVALGLARANGAANKTTFLVSTMTLYKTIMYFGMETLEEGKFTKHNTHSDLLLMVLIPSAFWIIVPAILICQSWSRLARGEDVIFETKTDKKRK